MTTVMSAIGEVAGVKPTDEVIGLAAVTAAKMKAQVYLAAILETTTPELRHIYSTHLQDVLTEHERYSALAVKRGWYKAHASAGEILSQAVQQAEPVVK